MIFKNCKVEQYVIRKNALERYYPKVKTIVWECEGNCLITNILVNIIRCRKGIFIIFSVLHYEEKIIYNWLYCMIFIYIHICVCLQRINK